MISAIAYQRPEAEAVGQAAEACSSIMHMIVQVAYQREILIDEDS